LSSDSAQTLARSDADLLAQPGAGANQDREAIGRACSAAARYSGTGSHWIRAIGHAATANNPAVTRNASAMLVVAISTPLSSAPTRNAPLSIALHTAFEAAS